MSVTLMILDMTWHEKKGMVGLVGFDPASGECVRPMPVWESLCAERGIAPGVPVALEGTPYGHPPFVEDFFLDEVINVGKANPAAMRKMLVRTCKRSLERALGCPVKDHSHVVKEDDRLPHASVFTIRVARSKIKISPDNRATHPEIIRLIFQNDAVWYNLPILQLDWFLAARKNRMTAIQNLHVHLRKFENVFLRIGLGALHPDGCWHLQVHGVYGAP